MPSLALRWARPALLNFGPNDADYVRGFRSDWERDGRTTFHWTSQGANVTLPLRISGDGALLRMRLRRHFIEPARVRLFVEGQVVHSFEIQADPKVAYRTIEVPLPRLQGRHPFVLSIEAPSDEPRPLGIALDWLEVERSSNSSFQLPARIHMVFLVTALAGFLAPRLAGSSRAASAAFAIALVAAWAAGSAWDVVAAERIAREGWLPFLAMAVVSVVLARPARLRAALGIQSPAAAGALSILALLALALRLAILLHPQYFYPDVRVHGTFALQLARRGVVEFLRDFTANQFRFSLGLQLVGEHWYAFPYPPVFYMLAAPLIALFNYRAEPAVSITAAWINSAEVFLIFALSRRLVSISGAALAASLFAATLPLFVARLTLAYFPALVGHFVDTLAILMLVSRLRELAQPRVVLVLGAVLALALLTYTQGLLNFGVLLGLFLLLDGALDRSRDARRRQLGLACAGLASLILAVVFFYGRYVPVLLDMWRGVPMQEERILIEKQERSRNVEDEVVPEEPDPYTGPNLDLLRGLRKAGWRLYVFYGLFAPIAALAVVRLARALPLELSRFVWAWALTYLVLNVLSGSLPGPNLVRYNKDLETIAPLICIAIGSATVDAWQSHRAWLRAAVVLLWGGYMSFAMTRAYQALTSTFVLER